MTKPPEFSGVSQVKGRSAPSEASSDRLTREYSQPSAQWGQFVFPLMDGHGSLYVRSLVFDAGGSPFAIGGGAVDADGLTTAEIGENTRAFPYGFNGATFDRLHSNANNADALAGIATGVLSVGSFNYAFNGATFDRLRTGSAANISAATAPAALLTAKRGQWSANHVPAANTQATATRAAGAAGVRHVAQTIAAEFSVDTAGVPVRTLLTLRDGATGVGPILWQIGMSYAGLPVGSNIRVNFPGLELFGTAATAMTLEFDVAGGANTFESVSLTGYSAG